MLAAPAVYSVHSVYSTQIRSLEDSICSCAVFLNPALMCVFTCQTIRQQEDYSKTETLTEKHMKAALVSLKMLICNPRGQGLPLCSAAAEDDTEVSLCLYPAHSQWLIYYVYLVCLYIKRLFLIVSSKCSVNSVRMCFKYINSD